MIIFHGDNDGFSFSNTAGLVNRNGSPADTDGDGLLEPGEFLPQLNLFQDSNPQGINPSTGDFFDNRETNDPLTTDVGVLLDSLFSINFSYVVPENHIITNVEFGIVIGDPSFTNRSSHTISVEGILTGETIVPQASSADGQITETIIALDSSLFSLLQDGNAQISIYYSSSPDG